MYLVMPEIAGTDLKILLALEGPLEPWRAVALLSEVAGALDALNARGILHRDIKPGNVIVVPGEGPTAAGRAYLTDFGLGKDPTRDSAPLTAIGEFVGTFQYVAPEQVLAKGIDHRVDLYSLGCVLYECLTGRPPFAYEREVEVLDAHVEEPPPKVTESRPGLPAEIDEVVARAMAKDPGDRYASAMDMVDAARSALGDGERPPEPASAGGPPGELRLRVTAGRQIAAEIRVTDEFVIGRHSTEEGKLAGDVEISRRHCRIWRGEASYMIEDLGSTNGTVVSGQKIESRRPLTKGDVVEVGGTKLLVETIAGSSDTVEQPSAATGAGRVAVNLEIDFDAREASVSVGEGPAVRLVERGGRWTVEPT